MANHELILSDPRVVDFLLQKLLLTTTKTGERSLSALTRLATNPDVAMRQLLQDVAINNMFTHPELLHSIIDALRTFVAESASNHLQVRADLVAYSCIPINQAPRTPCLPVTAASSCDKECVLQFITQDASNFIIKCASVRGPGLQFGTPAAVATC